MSDSETRPVEGLKKVRVRPVLDEFAPENSPALSAETVRRLTPSPPPPFALICVKLDVVTVKRTFETCSQRASARRAAPTTSLPAFMLAGGELSELERATVMLVLGHFIWTVAEESVNWSV